MSAVTFLRPAAAAPVLVAANAVLRDYATKGQPLVLIGALLLVCPGNRLTVQVMRLNGLSLAIALSAIFRLVAFSVMAILVFGERRKRLRPAGMALGCVAVAMIAWPKGAKG
jgi:small multidrug resistance pump